MLLLRLHLVYDFSRALGTNLTVVAAASAVPVVLVVGQYQSWKEQARAQVTFEWQARSAAVLRQLHHQEKQE